MRLYRSLVSPLRTLLSASVLIAGVAMACLLLAGTLTLTSETLRVWLVHRVIDSVNARGDIHIRIDGLTSPTPGQWQVRKLLINHQKQRWIHSQFIALEWHPGALLDRALLIKSLSVDELSLYPRQHNLKPDQKTDRPLTTADLQLSVPLSYIRFDTLTIRTLNLHGLIATAPAPSTLSYTLNGKAQWQNNALPELAITVRSLSQVPTHITVQSQAHNRDSIKLTGNIRESAGGFIGQRLHLPVTQNIEAGFNLHLTLDEQHINIAINTLAFPLAQRTVRATSQLTVVRETMHLSVDTLNLFIDETAHTVTGNWRGTQLDFHASLNQLPVDIITPWLPSLHSGTITGTLSIGGTTTQPAIRGKLVTAGIYHQIPFYIAVSGSATKENIVFESVTARLAKATIDVTGRLAINAATSDLTISINNLDVDTVKLLTDRVPAALTATRVSARARLYGSLQQPEGHVALSGSGQYQDLPFNVSADLTRTLSRLTINNASLTSGRGNIKLNGDIQLPSQQARLQLDATAIPLAWVTLSGVSLPQTLAATVSTQATIAGKLTQPQIAATATVDGHYQSIPFAINVSGNYQNNNLQVKKLDLKTFDETTLTASGYYRPSQFDVRVQAHRLPSALLDNTGWRVKPGYFHANAHSYGTVDNPVLNGTVVYETLLTDLNKPEAGSDVAFNWTLNANTRDDSVHLTSIIKRDEHVSSQLTVKIPTPFYQHYLQQDTAGKHLPDMPLRATIDGTFDLQALSFLYDADLYRIGGNIDANLTLAGTVKAPTINGSVSLHNAHYENTALGTTLQAIDCKIIMTHTRLNTDNCRATDGGEGRYEMQGDVTLPIGHSGQVAVTLNVDNASLLRQPQIEGYATGNLTVTGDFKQLLARGRLEVSPFTALIDSAFANDTPRIEVKEIDASETHTTNLPEQTNKLPAITLDLLISASQQAYLRGRGLDAELQGTISVAGELQKPDYTGQLNTVRGVFELFGKKFQLEQGQIRFANNAIALSITGVYKKDQQQIKATLAGTNDKLTVTLSSTPTMAEDEILAFIIFGKTLKKISALEAIQLASAIQTLRGGDSFFNPITRTREALGLDTLSVETEQAPDGERGINVGMGKYLSDNVYLELKRTSDPVQPWKGNLEIELTPNLNLETSTGGNAGVDSTQIKWKKNY